MLIYLGCQQFGCGVKLQHCAVIPPVGGSGDRGVPGVVQGRGGGGETGLAAPAGTSAQGLGWGQKGTCDPELATAAL